VNESNDPLSSPLPPRPVLEGLDLRQLMAEGMGLDPESAGSDEVPSVPGYEFLRLLGAGGMGRVYLARQLSLDRLVAVKVLASGGNAASQWLDRLEREAHAMARVRHPNIVAVYDFIRLDDGGAAIVMEWIESGNLRERWLAAGRPVRSLDIVVTVIREIASSLAAAHRAGIVHRDLKPENVLIALDGSVKVTDFGLALPLDGDSRRFTLTGTSAGTLGYMAPEQIEGRHVDERADLYSLGVILYEMLTGIRPQGHFDPPRAIRRDVPPRLERLTLSALRTRPAKRVASADVFLKELDALRGGGRAMKVLLPAALALLLGGTALYFFPKPDAPVETVFVQRNPVIREQPTATEPSAEPLPAPASQPVPEPPTEPEPAPEPVPVPVPVTPPPPVAAPVAALPRPPTAPAQPVLNRPDGLPPGFTIPGTMWPQVAVKPLRGEWVPDSDGYRSDGTAAVLQILTALPPRGADVRIAFTRTGGKDSIALFFRGPGGAASAEVSAWETGLAGIQNLDGADLRALGDPPLFSLINGQRYEMLVEIRPDRVTLKMEGELIHEVNVAGRELGVAFPWAWETLEAGPTALALGSYESPTIFHEFEVTPVP
jgi:eukaryotic-like serine/threonine-protein kinase